MSIQSRNDADLVQLYRKGNEKALEVLLERHKSKIFSNILIIVKEHKLAEDIFQETFFKVIVNIRKGFYTEEGKFLSWVIRISRNLIIDHYRKAGKMPPFPVYKNENGEELNIFDKIASEEDTESSIEKNILKQNIRNLVNELPTDQREVVLMRIYYDMSFKEISDFTKVSINTALGRMRYALINLKKMLEEQDIATVLK